MLEQIKNIHIKGGPFTEQTSIELLPSRLNLLYGRNGSGKSTIAKCIKRLGKEDDGSGYSAETLEKELKEISVERTTLVTRIVEYLFEKEPNTMIGTIEYLKQQLGIQ